MDETPVPVTKKQIYLAAMAAALAGETPPELPAPKSKDDLFLGLVAYNLIQYLAEDGGE